MYVLNSIYFMYVRTCKSLGVYIEDTTFMKEASEIIHLWISNKNKNKKQLSRLNSYLGLQCTCISTNLKVFNKQAKYTNLFQTIQIYTFMSTRVD